ncbi:MAG: DUF1579 family protein [Ferruginibacter sp.]
MKQPQALKRLEKLIGKWTISGRSLNAKEDDIKGTATFEWILDGFFLLNKGEMQTGDIKIQSWSIIGYDSETDTFPEMVYGNMGSVALSYHWQIKGNEVTHWTKGSKYTGKFSKGGKLLDGGWRADGAKISPVNTYDATMHKIE